MLINQYWEEFKMEIKTAEEIRKAMKDKFENNGQLAFENICDSIMKKIEISALKNSRFFTVYDFERQLEYLERSLIKEGAEEKIIGYLKFILNSYKNKSDKELYNAFESQVVNLLIVKGYTVEKEEGLLNRFKITIRWDKEVDEVNE
jgi:hypothetical protein